ncbi:MAG: hypothetical protein ACLUN5_02605 [Oscillospiraceae bacterium]
MTPAFPPARRRRVERFCRPAGRRAGRGLRQGSGVDMQEADFTLPAAIPADLKRETVELAVELDFGTLCADDRRIDA